MDLIKKYKSLKIKEINLCRDILSVTNYKAFRALESDDFIVNGFIIPANIVKILNKIYKHNIYNYNYTDLRVYNYNKVKKVINKYIN
jgi:hypothetical protein